MTQLYVTVAFIIRPDGSQVLLSGCQTADTREAAHAAFVDSIQSPIAAGCLMHAKTDLVPLQMIREVYESEQIAKRNLP